MASTKIYTRGGDRGTTSLVTGDRVSKSDLRLEAYGSVDELNSQIGLLLSYLTDSKLSAEPKKSVMMILTQVQHQLFNMGSQLACNDQKIAEKLPSLGAANIEQLEKSIDHMQEVLPELKSFILPGGAVMASQAHVVRTVCRRVERICCQLAEEQDVSAFVIPYLNRLNDYFFVLARFLNLQMNIKDVIWEK